MSPLPSVRAPSSHAADAPAGDHRRLGGPRVVLRHDVAVADHDLGHGVVDPTSAPVGLADRPVVGVGGGVGDAGPVAAEPGEGGRAEQHDAGGPDAFEVVGVERRVHVEHHHVATRALVVAVDGHDVGDDHGAHGAVLPEWWPPSSPSGSSRCAGGRSGTTIRSTSAALNAATKASTTLRRSAAARSACWLGPLVRASVLARARCSALVTAHRAATLEPRQPAPGGQQRLLHRLVGVVQRAEHPVAVPSELAAVTGDQLGERLLVAGLRGSQRHATKSCPRGSPAARAPNGA